jgi:hypothetical protein
MAHEPDTRILAILEAMKSALKIIEEGTGGVLVATTPRQGQPLQGNDLKEAVTLGEAARVIHRHLEAAHLRVVEARVHVALALKELKDPSELPGLDAALEKMLRGGQR